MRSSRVPVGILLASLLLAGLPSTAAIAQQADPISVGNDIIEQLRTDLNKKLNQTVEVKFEEVPLREAVTNVADQIEADIVFAENVLKELGLTVDKPVTCVLKHTELPARAAFELLLRPAGLTAVNREGILLITAEGPAEEIVYIQVYNVRDLVEDFAKTIEIPSGPPCECQESEDHDAAQHKEDRAEGPTPIRFSDRVRSLEGRGSGRRPCWASECLRWLGEPTALAMTSLIRAIQLQTDGPWFDIQGTGGSIFAFDGQLIITQTEENHAQIQKILDELRSNKNTQDHKQQTQKDKEKSLPPVAGFLPNN